MGLIILSSLVIVYSRHQISICDDVTCLYESVRAIYQPLLIFLEYFIYLLLAFLVMPSRYFQRWLLYVASWGLPILFLVIANLASPAYSSGFMTDRATDVLVGTLIFIAFSVVAVAAFFLYDIWQWYKTKQVTDKR